jgi:putative NADPH-quinone reductase
MGSRILIIQGHPDPAGGRLCHALAKSYAGGASAAGHEVRNLDIAHLDFPILRTQDDFENSLPPAAIRAAQDDIRWAEHLVIIHPLWHSGMPALLWAFFEQTFRYGFFAEKSTAGKRWPKRLLLGRSAHVVITMGMPAMFHRWYMHAHGLKMFTGGVLWWSGITPARSTLIGSVGGMTQQKAQYWINRLNAAGRQAR